MSDKHGIYQFVLRIKTPVHAGVFTTRTVSTGPSTAVHRWSRSFSPASMPRVHTVCCTGSIHRHLCSFIENICTLMAPVFTLSLRWLHGTSLLNTEVHGTNMGDFHFVQDDVEFKRLIFFFLTQTTKCLRTMSDAYTFYDGLSRTITDWRSGMIRRLIRERGKGAEVRADGDRRLSLYLLISWRLSWK
jgi:hypothetical protein